MNTAYLHEEGTRFSKKGSTCSSKDREGKGTSLLEGFWRSVDAITGGGKGCRLEGQISSRMEVRMIRETQEGGSQEGEEDQRRG